jgi:nicotinate phosphoribosyltransferase
MVQAAAGRPVAEFGFRRAQAPLVAAYAARIGGCASTSFLAASAAFGLPASGTIPHALVQLFDEEEQAFRAVAAAHDRFRLLLDTYDTLRAAATAVRVGTWARVNLQHELVAVRLDSGDLEALSRQVRQILDDGGFSETQILASGDLDEWKIADLVERQAPVDGFGVGTSLVDGLGSLEHAAEGGALGGVYKLAWVEADAGNPSHAAIKLAGAKTTVPGVKQAARASDGSHDLLLLASEAIPAGFTGLLEPAITSGHMLEAFAADTLAAASGRAAADLAVLPAEWKALAPGRVYPVEFSLALQEMVARVTAQKDEPYLAGSSS